MACFTPQPMINKFKNKVLENNYYRTGIAADVIPDLAVVDSVIYRNNPWCSG
jgi:hypothetical protein